MLFRLSILVCLFLPNFITAQKIERVRFFQEGQEVLVFYDLIGSSTNTYSVSLYYSWDRGRTFQGPLIKVRGDYGDVRPSINREIIWSPMQEVPSFKSNQVIIKVCAKVNVLKNINKSRIESERLKNIFRERRRLKNNTEKPKVIIIDDD